MTRSGLTHSDAASAQPADAATHSSADQPQASAAAPYALLLAAGEARRFGGPKLLRLVGGRPLVSHVLETIVAARESGSLRGGIAVVPAGARELAGLVRAAGLLPVVSDGSRRTGLGVSLRLGLRTLRADFHDAAAAVVFLADQPLVSAAVVGDLVRTWRKGRAQVVRPRYAAAPEQPGHPVLLDRAVWPLSERLEGETGLGPSLQSADVPVATLDVEGANPDVDSEGDLALVEALTARAAVVGR